ncbi:50S ribosomal protein L15 [Candidatus Fermentibacteria bacterium]|nr:50S ribosomal protein L15 [Candidatus Fermentibacteria bacterium]
MNELSNLKYAPGSRKPKFRKGRGPGSGNGKTAGRGNKGLNSRSGGGMATWHEGGQMPLQRRLPKRGFTNIFRVETAIIHTDDLLRFSPDEPVTVKKLRESGLVTVGGKKDVRVKILSGVRPLTAAYTVAAHAFSAGARSMIEAAGGRVEVVAR